VVSGQAARLPVLIDAARAGGADLLILDTAPNADQTALRAAQLADMVLVPCRAAAFDLEAIKTTLTLAQIAQKPSFVVLNAVPPRSSVGREAAEGLKGQGAQVAPVTLSQRAAFAHGVIDGRTAQEFEPGGKATEEVDRLYLWLCGVVDMPACPQARKAA
jgi:chromosome partitioning protein